MLLRRLLHSARHLRHGLQTVTLGAATTTTTVPSSSSPLPFRRLAGIPPSRVLAPRFLSTSGRDDDTNKPWDLAPELSDPDPFADVEAAAGACDAPLGSAPAVDDTWAKGFRSVDGENGDVFEEEIYKEGASAPPARGEAAPTGDDEQWTLSGDEEKDPFAAAVLGEGIEGIDGEGAGLDELNTEEDAEAELKRQQTRAREKELMETLKGDHLKSPFLYVFEYQGGVVIRTMRMMWLCLCVGLVSSAQV
jgi:small subunit ribosomal protein S9